MKNRYLELDEAIESSKTQKAIYQPSSFWKEAAQDIVRSIEECGVENFRRLEVPLSYFVPNYGIPTNSFDQKTKENVTSFLNGIGTKKQSLAMQEFLSGYFHALSDYRVFTAADNSNIRPDLKKFSESNYGNPIEQFTFDGKVYSRSALNYLIGLCFLKKHLVSEEEIETVLEVGGGFGTLGEILHSAGNMKYIDIDIPPMSFIARAYLGSVYKQEDIEPYLHDEKEIKIEELKSCSVFNSWDIELLEGNIDLFVNFISFQEMEPDIVQNYLKHVKRLSPKYILLRNMREGKQVKKTPDGDGVETPIMSENYIAMIKGDYSLLASNVFPYGYKTVDGFHSELLLFKRHHD